MIAQIKGLRIPRSAMLGALVALASYGVSSIVKVSIDGQLRTANQLVEKASQIEHSLGLFPLFSSHLFMQKEQNAVLKLLLGLTMGDKGRAGLPQFFDPSLLTVERINPFDVSVRFGPSLLATSYLGQLPEAIIRSDIPAGDPIFDPKQKLHSNANLVACEQIITPRLQESGHEIIAGVIAKYPEIENYPRTLAHYFHGIMQRSQMLVDWSAAMPVAFGLLPSGVPETPEQQRMAEVAFHYMRRVEDMCIERARQQINDDFRVALIQTRTAITADIIQPLSGRRKLVEWLEMALYVVGALLALAKQAKPDDRMIT